MNDSTVWATWPSGAPTLFIILALVSLNIIFLYLAWAQKRRRRKVERDLLALQTFGSASPLAAKRPVNKETPHLKTEKCETVSDDLLLLKIDRAIAMLKKGSSLDEIRTSLDVETSYLKILAAHHTG